MNWGLSGWMKLAQAEEICFLCTLGNETHEKRACGLVCGGRGAQGSYYRPREEEDMNENNFPAVNGL
jgi:hypothetical protein